MSVPVTEPPLPLRQWHSGQSGRSLALDVLSEGLRGQQEPEVSPRSGAAAGPGISDGAENVRLSASLCWQRPAPGQDVPKVLQFLGRVVVIRGSYRYCMTIIEISVLMAEMLLIKAVTS